MNNNNTQLNETLYINNLNEKIKIDELKSSLRTLFGKHGTIIEIRARNTIKLKGQAFITFSTQPEATDALTALNGKDFLGKPLQIAYAHNKSDIVLFKQGKLSKEDKQQKDLERKRKRDKEYNLLKLKVKELNEQQQKENEILNKEQQKVIQPTKINLDENAFNVLFVSGVSQKINDDELKALFQQCPGFKVIKRFQNSGICFVEYDTIIEATNAILKLNNIKIGDSIITVVYAKKNK